MSQKQSATQFNIEKPEISPDVDGGIEIETDAEAEATTTETDGGVPTHTETHRDEVGETEEQTETETAADTQTGGETQTMIAPDVDVEVDRSTESLSELPTTKNGAVRKKDAMRWLKRLDKPTDREICESIVTKPSDFTGGTYSTGISVVRLTGDPEFVETVAGLFKTITEFESDSTRVEVTLQETEDRDTGEPTGNYALYLSVAERG